MSKPINILSTKKLLETQKQLLQHPNFQVIEDNFIQTAPKKFELKNINQNLIFTSQNAVLSVLSNPKSEELKTKNVFCVGIKTKNLLTQNGFNVLAYTGYASDLAQIITLIYNKENYTFFSGNIRRDTLPTALTKNNITFNEIEVYETNLTPKKITQTPQAILFFSPSGVESFLEKNKITTQICFCIGETTAETLENKNIKNIIIAQYPTVENVIEEVIQYYNH